ncbi:MAG: hypothetical protein ACE5MK_05275 [Acidobacteriota bacterium]
MGRKYRQPGYEEGSEERRESRRSRGKPLREGPRSPRMAGFHKVMRCAMCGTHLPPSFTDVTFSSRCPKCGTDLHTCKNCVYFDPSSRFECTQPIPEWIPRKDVRNDCQYFEARTTVEKITTSGSQKPQDAREAFENLFKK